MARRTKRRPRVVWLPQDPFFSINSAGLANSTIMRVSDTLTAVSIGDSSTVVIPVVRDTPPNPLTPANSLADIYDSGYRLRRIVGKFWCFVDTTPPDGITPGAAVVTAGFIILRTDQGTQSIPAQPGEAYSTNDILNTESPWIWRRSWLLANQGSLNSPPFGSNDTNANQPFLNSNRNIGGIADGPHIDQKTARNIGPDERLFLVVTATALTVGDQQVPLLLDYVFDVRVLASMRSMVGNRGNASR